MVHGHGHGHGQQRDGAVGRGVLGWAWVGGYHHLEGGVARVVDAQRREPRLRHAGGEGCKHLQGGVEAPEGREPRLVRVVLLARLALVLALGVVDGARGDEDGDHHEEEDRRELRKVGM